MTNSKRSIGIVGARGYVGSELIKLVANHRQLELAFVSSRSLTGAAVSEHVPAYRGDLHFEDVEPADICDRAFDAIVLALPNGLAQEYVSRIDAMSDGCDRVIVDVSADYRFDDAWVYGQPERLRSKIQRARRISNPGCYATAGQLALWPIRDLIDGCATVFGVSGYSGAGSTPSPKNDPNVLRDNLLPYALTDHIHEREMARQLGCPVAFMPHVAPFFRGITVTASAHLKGEHTVESIAKRFETALGDEPLVRWLGTDVPMVREIAQKHDVAIGGLTVSKDGRRAVVVATIDNLLKGAATQAMQNLNLALGIDELEGIRSS